MLPYQTLLSINKENKAPLYQQISSQLVALIRDGVIKPGSLLPGSRELAVLLGVHRKTIVAAYEDLFTQDWIETIPRKGVVVAQHLPEINPRRIDESSAIPAYAGNTGFTFERSVPFPANLIKSGEYRLVINDGFPDQRIAPVDALMREYRSLFHMPVHIRNSNHNSLNGSPTLRSVLVKYLGESRGVNIGVQNILLTHGAQMAIYLAAKLLIKPGSVVLVGEPNYFLADLIFQQFGGKLVKVPMDENGMDIGFIEQFCKTKTPDLLYIIPHHHHPTTVTLSSERRMRLLELIRNYKIPVIEDDYDYDYHYNGSPILPLASAHHNGNVIYIGSLTKSLTTSVRIGYMIAPENFISEAAVIRTILDIRNDYLFEDALAAIMQSGEMHKYLKKAVKLYHGRRDYLCQQLDSQLKDIVTYTKPAGGMAVWARFNKKYPLPAIAARAAAEGLSMSDGSVYSYGTENLNSMRIGFSGLNEKEIDLAIGIIKKVVEKM